MPAQTPPPEQNETALPNPSYPALEAFAERAIPDEVAQVLAQVEQSLAGLKGPVSAKREKVATAISRTRELLSLLVQTRLQLERETKGGR